MSRELIDWDGPLSIVTQARFLTLPRSTLYATPQPLSSVDQAALNAIDELYTAHPFYGSRRLRADLRRRYALSLGRDHVRRLMRTLGLAAIVPKKHTSTANADHPAFPYLLAHRPILRPNHVWGTDFTYIRLRHGFAYLIAFLYWFNRYSEPFTVMARPRSPTVTREASLRVAST